MGLIPCFCNSVGAGTDVPVMCIVIIMSPNRAGVEALCHCVPCVKGEQWVCEHVSELSVGVENMW